MDAQVFDALCLSEFSWVLVRFGLCHGDAGNDGCLFSSDCERDPKVHCQVRWFLHRSVDSLTEHWIIPVSVSIAVIPNFS